MTFRGPQKMEDSDPLYNPPPTHISRSAPAVALKTVETLHWQTWPSVVGSQGPCWGQGGRQVMFVCLCHWRENEARVNPF